MVAVDPATLVDAAEGASSPQIFVDSEIYRRELLRIFGTQWLFVAHESEIRRPGDFVTRFMGSDPVIVVRGADGVVRVLLNVCRHRGRWLCSQEMGQAASFMCPYHGWTYSATGELIDVPFFDVYQGQLDPAALGLHPALRVESYHGLIFANWGQEGASLREYLGPLTWVLDLLFGRTAGMEVVGPPVKGIVNANWKLAAATFAGNGHHIFTPHGFRTHLLLETPVSNRKSFVLPTPEGHGSTLTCWPGETPGAPYLALPNEIVPEIRSRLALEQGSLLESLMLIVGNVFPNLSFLQTVSHTPAEWGGAPDEPPMSFLTMRQWQPKGATRMQVWTWLLQDVNAPHAWKEATRACYLREFGRASVFEDEEAGVASWWDITESLQGAISQQLQLQDRRGLKVARAPDWPGPGDAYPRESCEELNERVFYRRWQELVGETR